MRKQINHSGVFGTWLIGQLMVHKSTLRMYAKYFNESYEKLVGMAEEDRKVDDQ